jgi:hypothetical protein
MGQAGNGHFSMIPVKPGFSRLIHASKVPQLIPVISPSESPDYANRMSSLMGRLQREHATLECMTSIYCAHHHESPGNEPCKTCAELLGYSARRLEKCPYGQHKPTCARCPVHCYKKQQREQVQAIMRFSGPRMTLRHPWRALQHLIDRFRPAPHPLELRRRRKASPD